MTYIVDNAMVAHLWAHQLQDCAQGYGHFYFEGTEIYSYGSHFRCASIVTNNEGNKAYLVTTRTYSATTAEHMSKVRRAIPCGATVFNTPRYISLRDGKLAKYEYLEAVYFIVDHLEIIDECIKKQKKSRSIDYSGQVEKTLSSINQWISFWGLDKKQKSKEGIWLMPVINKLLSHKQADVDKFWKVSGQRSQYSFDTPYTDQSGLQQLLEIIKAEEMILSSEKHSFRTQVTRLFEQYSGDSDIWSKFETRRVKQEESNRLRDEIRERRWAEEQERWKLQEEERNRIKHLNYEERLDKWKNGELVSAWFDVPTDFAYNALLRIKNSQVETSMGIRINLPEVTRLWTLIQRFHTKEIEFHHDIVHDTKNNKWSINSYSNDILTAGCHRIAYSEMRDIASQLGLVA